MNTNDYEDQAMRTAKDIGSRQMNLIHCALGITSEAGEFADAIKAHAIYGKPLDMLNCIEELGDLVWYVALACDTLEISMEDIMMANIAKLKVRYPHKYSDVDALARADKQADWSAA